MIKKISIFTILFVLNGCLFAGFNKGSFPSDISGFEQDMINDNVVLKKENSLYMEFSSHQCGYYGLIGVIIPIIPYWHNNTDCNNFNIYINKASNVYLKHNGKTYNYVDYKPKSYFNYEFSVPAKTLSDGAILVIEKDGKTFEIPFRYQHTFSFQMWGV